MGIPPLFPSSPGLYIGLQKAHQGLQSESSIGCSGHHYTPCEDGAQVSASAGGVDVGAAGTGVWTGAGGGTGGGVSEGVGSESGGGGMWRGGGGGGVSLNTGGRRLTGTPPEVGSGRSLVVASGVDSGGASVGVGVTLLQLSVV
jgi:hypothetical protein